MLALPVVCSCQQRMQGTCRGRAAQWELIQLMRGPRRNYSVAWWLLTCSGQHMQGACRKHVSCWFAVASTCKEQQEAWLLVCSGQHMQGPCRKYRGALQELSGKACLPNLWGSRSLAREMKMAPRKTPKQICTHTHTHTHSQHMQKGASEFQMAHECFKHIRGSCDNSTAALAD